MSIASSLGLAFSDIAEAFAKDYGANVSVDINVGASSAVAEAILGGAPVDVFASADQANMGKVLDAGLVAGNPRTFAHNQLVIVTRPGNPADIGGLDDLPGAGVVSLCALQVPCGNYAAQALASAKVTIDESRVTRGQTAAATLEAVARGDAVAGIVYVTDARAQKDAVDTVDIPAAQNVVASYPIAVVGKQKKASKAFVDFVVGKDGRRILQRYGFLP